MEDGRDDIADLSVRRLGALISKIFMNKPEMIKTGIRDVKFGKNVRVAAEMVNLYECTIGDDCFVGSDSVLVAPIEIGPGAYVAAGSVLTRNVPSRALGIGRARQENKPGYRDVLDRRRGLRSTGEDAGSAATQGEGSTSEPEGSAGA